MPKDNKQFFDEKAEQINKRQQLNNLDEEFAEPMDEHSIEERERAQRTGDDCGCGKKHDHESGTRENIRNNERRD
ncbi:MAG: hypothetical protein ABF868_06100 [Sporolactobacillus sp.]